MKGLRRIISCLIVVSMLVSMLPMTVWAKEEGETIGGNCGEKLKWSFDETSGTLTISGSGDMDDYSWSQMYDPTGQHSDEWVTTAPWRNYCHSIKSIVIDPNVTSIGKGAFRGCFDVTSISLSNDVANIGEYSFMDCDDLTEIVIPENVKTISEAAFGDCSALESLTILGATSVENFAFSECVNLMCIELPDTLISIGDYAFRGCEALKEVNIPSSVQTIGTFAFVWCDSLENIYFEGNAPSMDNSVLSGLTCNAYYPSNDETWNEELRKDFDNTITWIERDSGGGSSHSHSFGDWYETKVPTQEEEGEDRRDCTGCDHFETRVVEKLPSSGDSHEHSFTSKVTSPSCTKQGFTTYFCDCGESYIADYIDANGHVFTNWYQTKAPTQEEEGEERRNCQKCEHFETNVLDKILSEEDVFQGVNETVYAVSLANVRVKPAVSSSRLGTLYEGESIVRTGINAAGWSRVIFNGVEGYILSVYLSTHKHSYQTIITPPSCTEQGYTTFTCECGKNYVDDYVSATGHAYDDGAITINPGCETEGIKTFTCANDPTHTYTESMSASGHNFGEWYETKAPTYESEGEERRECALCDDFEVRSKAKLPAEDDPFSGSCGNNLRWTFADSVLTIMGTGSMSFDPSSQIESTIPWYDFRDLIETVIIEYGVTTIASYAFTSCGNLVNVEIADTVIRIEANAFDSCSSLSSIILPNSLTSLGGWAFVGCSSLTEIDIPNGVDTIYFNTFSGCTSLKSIRLPQSLHTIKKHAFVGCKALNNVELPEGIQSIDTGVFYECSGIERIYIPASVKTIGMTAFFRGNLKDVYFGGTKEEWESIKNEGGNGGLTGAKIHYNCEGIEINTEDDLKQTMTFNGHTYERYDIPMTWTEAKKYCEDLGGYLVTITSSEEQTAIEGLLSNGEKTQYWLGAKYINGNYNWVTGESFSFSHGDIHHNGGEYYLLMFAKEINDSYYKFEQFCWNDVVEDLDSYGYTPIGSSTVGFICEYGDIKEEGVTPVQEITYNNNRYERYDVAMTWTEAKAFCEEKGGHLVTFSSKDESTAVLEMIKENPKNCYWIGLYRGNTDSTWKWVTDEEVTYTNWAANEPNNQHNAGEYYTHLYGITPVGQWNDTLVAGAEQSGVFNSLENFGFICEYSNTDDKISGTVCYYSAWDAANRVAYFGPGDKLGSKVTEETASAFALNPSNLVGQYVLVETKPTTSEQVGPDILLSVKSVETKIGTVSSANSDSITIGSNNYKTPADIGSPELYTDKFVVYHLYNGKLVGIEILEEKTGVLTYWNKEANAINIKQKANDKDVILYHLSSTADKNTVSLLGSTGNRNERIQYYTDCNNILFHIEAFGFNPENDAWSFRNDFDGFEYDYPDRISEERYEKVFGASYVASAKASDNDVYNSMMPTWGGNCYGMSVTSVLFYLNMLDWDNYSDGGFDAVNDYYSEVKRLNFSDDLYTVSKQGRPITELIESYQILQWGSKDGYRFADSTVDIAQSTEYRVLCSDSNNSEFKNYDSYYIHNPGGHYIQTLLDTISATDVPLIINIHGTSNDKPAGHALVLRTDIPPQKMNDGTYRVYVYDPNHPYLSDEIIGEFTPASYYSNGDNLYIELNPGINQWRYCGSVNGSAADNYWGSDLNWNVLSFGTSDKEIYTPDLIYVSYIHNIDIPLKFNGTEPWLSKYESKTGFVFNGSMDIYSENNDLICSVKEGIPTYFTNEVEFTPFINAFEDKSSLLQGRVTIPYTKFRIDYKDGSDISIIGFDNVVNVASSGNITLNVDINDGNVEILCNENSEIITQITNVYSSSVYSSIVADGKSRIGDCITLRLSEDQFDAYYNGNGSLEVITDNERMPGGQHIISLDRSDGKIIIDDVREVSSDEHNNHTADSGWLFDSTNHWHTCTGCEEIMDLAFHTGGTATCMVKAVCAVCNQPYGEKDPENHTRKTTITGKKDATCGTDGYTGDAVCECGATITKGKVILATGKHTGGTATCMAKAVCKVCGQSYGEKNPNNHSFTKYHSDHNATCKKNGTKTAKCDFGCGKTNTVTDRGSKLSHKFDGDKCVRCGVSRWNPDTGDKIMIAVAILVISGAALLVLFTRKKRK